MHASNRVPCPRHGSQLGVTLIELMVALAIGSFLMIGAITVFVQSRTTFRVTESVSRLQENARFALETMEPDIRMAGYFGLMSRSAGIKGRAATTAPAGPVPGPATCGTNWAIDLNNPIAGTNNAYGWTCTPGNYRAGTDTVLVRRVSEDPVAALVANRVYVQTSRNGQGEIFTGTVIPATFTAATSQTFQLVANGYYIARTTPSLGVPGNTIPSLRRRTLTTTALIQDTEILPGVEDLQIQFGVDTDLVDENGRGSVDRYVNANDPILNPASAAFIDDAVILSVRLWLRLRAENPENGFTDTTNYVYADQNFTPNAAEQPFRRVLVSTTIYLHNMRPAS